MPVHNFKNEKGAALVLTLMIVTLFLLFILTQFYQVTNTTKQVTTMEKNINARNVAEMGIEYYFQKIKYEYEKDPTKEVSEIIADIDGEEVRLDEDRNFQLLAPDPNEPNKIRAKGTAFGKEAIVENEITLVDN